MKPRTFRKPSIKDVALRAGVSTTTISCFVNGNTTICAPETAKRIRAAIDELQYTPNSLSRGLVRGSTRTIGVCFHSPLDPGIRFGSQFLEQVWRGIVLETDAANYSILHYPLPVRVGSTADAFLDGRVDGVVFHGDGREKRAAEVARAGMPVVLLTRSQDIPEGCTGVYANERQTIALAIDHLRSLGHRRIAHLAGPVEMHSGNTAVGWASDIASLRLTAYTEMQKAAGLFDPALVGYAASWRNDTGRVAPLVAEWHSLPDPPTAVVCANDMLALAVLEAATDQGWVVPDSLSIVGIDDSIKAHQAVVPLTSVNIPVEEIGRESIRSLLRLMEGEPIEEYGVAVPVTELTVRDSTAPCRHNTDK